ncbi:glycosyltransferase, putative [Methylophaga frappieri]|uniref:Glycosyltransferase, putative n=1 Tax=Methylophaga frappieri (strain ATCC BAA-2434 / DSM 25690 / JAM7) TaxID=754477 RepID=I1YKI8_METFJ|nr:glycosyltransferase [Methylophaga frappieri]AFJ03431.1 glycosyltransferase, putative [Methylophaga frappieri]
MHILLLTTYPVAVPRHGGQIRAAEIARFYRQQGHSVQVAGVLGSATYASAPGFVPFPDEKQLNQWADPLFLMEDVAIGEHFLKNDDAFAALSRVIQPVPDVIHVEQPWLMGFAQRFIQQTHASAPLIYGSQNIEAPLKAAIVKTYYGQQIAENQAQQVRAMENAAIEMADSVSCVSEEDALYTRQRTSKPVVVAPNGVTECHADKAAFAAAAKMSQGRQYALYCASAHPPNIHGFFDWLGGSNGALDHDQRIIVAGSAGQAIQDDDRFHQSPGLPAVFIQAGLVDDSTLAGLIAGAHAMILPISAGGGTNLKTAEALYSGQHVLASPKAMRGFEPFENDAGVVIAESAGQFKRQLRHMMAQPPLQLDATARQSRQSLRWSHCLQPLGDLIS